MFFRILSAASIGSALMLSACGSDQSAPPAPEPEAETPVAEPAAELPDNPFEGLPAPYQTADYNRGRRTYKLCQSCHTLQEGGPNLVGPNLYGVFGRQAASVEGHKFSDALTESGIVWTPEILDDWLTNPNSFLPGNIMSFSGVRRPDDRLGVIAYIMLETGYSAEE